METVNQKTAAEYQKQHSFEEFKSKNKDVVRLQTERVLRALAQPALKLDFANKTTPSAEIINKVKHDLTVEKGAHCDTPRFMITEFLADESRTIDDVALPRYLNHRYRYDIFPLTRTLDEYPPYLPTAAKELLARPITNTSDINSVVRGPDRMRRMAMCPPFLRAFPSLRPVFPVLR